MYSSVIKFFFLGVLLSSSSVFAKRTMKRGIPDFGLSSFSGGYDSAPQDFSFGFPQSAPVFINPGPTFTIQKQISYQAPVSSADIASAIAAAKEASNQVHYAQQRVQAAKDAVLEQQRIANAKQSQAALAQQQSEAAAAISRQAASAASNAVVQAQQKLADAKSEVAEQQRYAAAKESLAAAIIQKSASAAAAEIQRSEHTAKIAALQRSEANAANQHASAAKDASLSATSAALAAANNIHSAPQPSNSQQFAKYHSWS